MTGLLASVFFVLFVIFAILLADTFSRLRKVRLRVRETCQQLKEAKELAGRDPLTGLLNRRGFEERAEPYLEEIAALLRGVEVRRSTLFGGGFSLVMVDVDFFKTVNDIRGHSGGDAALKALAGLLRGVARKVDLVARWGGEEFLLGLVGARENEAFAVAERIRRKVAETSLRWNGEEVRFTVSVGVARFAASRDGNLAGLVEKADEALRLAKKRGRNRVVKYVDAES